MVMFRAEMDDVFSKRWDEHRKTIPTEEQHRHVAKYRNVVAKELYDAAPVEVRNRVDAERMKKKGPDVEMEDSSEEEDEEEEEEGEMGEQAKEAKAAAQAEKKSKEDLAQALYYQE